MIFFLKIITQKRWPLCCLLFLLASCSRRDDIAFPQKNLISDKQTADDAFRSIFQAKKSVKQGDLILRTGKDFTSDMMRRLSLTDKTYSHCGIASLEHDTLFVYHAIGGEWNPNQKLRRDPFEFFCNPYENKGFGIFRYNLHNTGSGSLLTVVKNFYSAGIRFDMKFDLASDDRMYCSEFVYKAIKKATKNRITIPSTTLNSTEFIAVDNLYKNRYCVEVKRVLFKP